MQVAAGSLVALTLALGGCSLLEELGTRGGPQPEPSTRTDPAATADVLPIGSQKPIPSPATGTTAGPVASDPIPLPDAPGGIAHKPGERVEMPGGTVVFLGLQQSSNGVVARFEVTGEIANPRLVLPDGQIVSLTQRGEVLESGALTNPPAPGSELALVVGATLVVFETAGVTG
ncbi:MAG TPA: hypothetical protein VFH63_05750 [candidate division Zixibacteria bacterium]|nr:hypothetical protein [candidate division Zixibacteria bacterium]